MDAPFPETMMSEIERFFDNVHPQLEPGGTLYPAVFDNNLFFPLQRKAELRKMLEVCQQNILVGHRPTIMEIGADKGGGFYHFLMALQPQEAYAIEIRGTPYADRFIKAFPEIRLRFLSESSYRPDVVRRVEESLCGSKLDILFIDGDKSGFYKDFDAYLPIVKRGGLVLMHDFRDTGPSESFQEASRHPRVRKVQTILNVSDYEETAQREAQGHPAKNSYDQWLRHWKGQSCGVGVLYV